MAALWRSSKRSDKKCFFDTHAHLNDPAFDPDRESLLESFAEAGVGLVMNAGCSLAVKLSLIPVFT